MSALRWGFDRKAGARKRPVPLVRAVAYRGPYPILSGRTMAEVMRDEEEVRLGRPVLLRELDECPVVPPAPTKKKKAGPRIKSGVTKKEYQANARDDAGVDGATEAPVERVSRPAAGRSAAATSEIMDVTAGETAPVSHPVRAMPPKPVSAPVAVVAKPPLPDQPAPARDPSPQLLCTPKPLPTSALPHRERSTDDAYRAEMVRAAPAVDWQRVARAARARPIGPQAKAAPTRAALSPDPCRRCGVRGSIGCDHQLPFEADA